MKTVQISLLLSLVVLLAACGDDDHDHDHDSGETAATFVVQAMLSEDVQVGQNTLEIDVTDVDGVPVVMNNGDGTYSAFPITLQMAGDWVVTIHAMRGDEWGEFEFSVAAQ